MRPARLVHLADVVEVFHHAGGVEATLVKLFATEAEAIFSKLEQVATWDAVMGKAPTASRELDEDELDQALAASADFVDLKSPYTLGHSRLRRTRCPAARSTASTAAPSRRPALTPSRKCPAILSASRASRYGRGSDHA